MFKKLLLITTVLFFMFSVTCFAQQPPKDDFILKDFVDESSFESVGPMFEQMTKATIKAAFDTLARPDMADKLATFMKNYYDALIRKGFTKDEALRIVISTGIPSIATQQQ